MLKTQGSYNPNETDLKIATLETMLADMQSKNTAVVDASVAAKNARIARDSIFYNDADGILALVDLVKKYVKSIFGAGSPQHKQLTALKFRIPSWKANQTLLSKILPYKFHYVATHYICVF